jgi:hypothetical protein
MNPRPPKAYTKDTLKKDYLCFLNQHDSIKELATTPDVLVTLFLKAQRNGDDSLDTPSIQNFKNELKSLAGMMGELESKPTGNGASASKTSTASQFRSTATMPPFVSSSSNTGSPAAPNSGSPAAPNFGSSPAQHSHSAAPSAARSSQSFSSGASMPSHTAFASPSQAPLNHSQPLNHQEMPSTPPPSGFHSYAQHNAGESTSNTGPSSTGPGPSLPIEIIAQLDVKSRAMVGEVREQLNLGSDVEVLRLLISLGYKKARNLYS